MKLITAPASPYSRKVKALLYESNQMGDVELLNVKTSPVAVDEGVQAANPLGKIPCLLRDSDPALYDSRVICRFLDARSGGQFYPDGSIWDVLTIEATADGILDSALSMVYEKRFRDESIQSEAWFNAQKSKVLNGVAALNETWMSHLNGPIHMGHIAVGCALGYLDFRLDDLGWRAENEALAGWYAEFQSREAMKKTEPFDPA
ncbi:glutathione S-transferase [Cognatishimia activa]|uniref:Putative GST-like protein YibF n=1 Tax=Cognatishimia activa TaxID=1715691 RepID=A0A0P1ILZ4_9RHOB|nr:glutathione S-transferase [Cognatishimia activa]CUI44798.1 putative GST-like protein YibF [Cognatishimia activa]CUK24665.1 putative GST-like protein YibF [Cognatishimia activa]